LLQLNGTYDGTARGLYANGQEVVQIARFAFVRGQLTSFSEVFLFHTALM
jgi:hypothetical protein